MFGIGMPEFIIILVIAMLVFGAGKLPDVGNALGQAIRGFKKALEEPEKKMVRARQQRKSRIGRNDVIIR